jgi:hypothetical protein
MLTRQRDALQAVRRDLSNLDKPKAHFDEALVDQFLTSFLAFYFGAVGGALKVIVEHGLAKRLGEDGAKVFADASDKMFESLGLKEQVAHAIEDPKDPLATLDEWFDLRLRVLTENGLKSQLAFVQKIKPTLLTQPPSSARHWETSVGEAAAAAYKIQFDREISDWATYQAQAQLKKKSAKGGINLNDAPESTTGVLELALEGGEPKDGFEVRVTSARITGLSERTRLHLAKQPIEKLAGLPIAARGPIVAKGAAGRIEIGRNETGEFFSWSTDKIGEFWLRARAASREKPFEFLTAEDLLKVTPQDGAQGVFGRDLDVVVLRELKGGLDKA